MTDLSTLTEEESAELAQLYMAWTAARSAKDYTRADELRANLLQWQDPMVYLQEIPPKWHALFEPTAHRELRAKNRHD